MSNLTDFIGHNIIRSATEPTDKTKFWFNETYTLSIYSGIIVQ